MRVNRADSVSKILREVPGNDQCAECNASEPDWASLNLGILICIECSGIHRNLGVHISKVRSITLDVKVWEPAVLDLFRALGNAYCNSIWEDFLQLQCDSKAEMEDLPLVTKPGPKDAVHLKEKYIQAKYVKKLVYKDLNLSSSTIWEAVKANNLREVYRMAITSDMNLINSVYDEVAGCNSYHSEPESDKSLRDIACEKFDSSSDPEYCLQGWSLLHLACHSGNLVMLELLLQFGANINKCDFHGRTPLQHCILKGNIELAKFFLRRGARASIKDAWGFTALERAMEMGALTDGELFVLLSENE